MLDNFLQLFTVLTPLGLRSEVLVRLKTNPILKTGLLSSLLLSSPYCLEVSQLSARIPRESRRLRSHAGGDETVHC